MYLLLISTTQIKSMSAKLNTYLKMDSIQMVTKLIIAYVIISVIIHLTNIRIDRIKQLKTKKA